MEYTTALRGLMSIFATGVGNGNIRIDDSVYTFDRMFVSQPAFIQSMFPEFMSGIGVDKDDLSILQTVYCQ